MISFLEIQADIDNFFGENEFFKKFCTSIYKIILINIFTVVISAQVSDILFDVGSYDSLVFFIIIFMVLYALLFSNHKYSFAPYIYCLLLLSGAYLDFYIKCIIFISLFIINFFIIRIYEHFYETIKSSNKKKLQYWLYFITGIGSLETLSDIEDSVYKPVNVIDKILKNFIALIKLFYAYTVVMIIMFLLTFLLFIVFPFILIYINFAVFETNLSIFLVCSILLKSVFYLILFLPGILFSMFYVKLEISVQPLILLLIWGYLFSNIMLFQYPIDILYLSIVSYIFIIIFQLYVRYFENRWLQHSRNVK